MNMFHVNIVSVRSDAKQQEVTKSQTHYVVIADRPSRAVALLEEHGGWLGSDKLTVEMASAEMVPPNIELEQEAVWRI